MVKKTLSFGTARNIIVGLLLLALGGVIGYRYGQTGGGMPTPESFAQLIKSSPPPEKEYVDFKIFWEAWDKLEDEYLDPSKLDPKKMVNGAVSGMTSALDDPYTVYLAPVENQRRGEDLAGMFYGVGIELGYVDSTLAVVAPLKDMPADKAGVQPGDLILHVKDVEKNLDSDTSGWTLDEAVEKIRGKKDTIVTLTLFRKTNGSEPFTVDLKRGEIVLESVKLDFPEHNDKKVAHLRITTFGERTPKEFEDAVQKIIAEKNQIDGIVLDLRNNPGGLFDDAIDVASEFYPKGGTVVQQKDKYSQHSFPAKGKARLAGIPLVVLVNQGSASASEIVAGALRDEVGAKLVGEKTYGKGTVQDRIALSNGGGLHITIAQWLTPKGDSIHKTGIPVSVEIKDNLETKDVDEALQKAIEEL